jgi:hypothetical protein
MIDIPRWKWRNREALLQELDARVRIKDIRAVYDLKDAIAFKWWEPLLKMIVLLAGVGFAVTAVHFLDRSIDLYGALAAESPGRALDSQALKMIFWFIAGSFALMLVAGMISLEVMLMRVSAMRRMQEIQLRVIENLQAEVEELRGLIRPGTAPDASPREE